MYHKLRQELQLLAAQFDAIPAERKLLLEKISAFVQARYAQNKPIQLLYVCTHNSRRSHFGQVAAALAAAYYNINAVSSYSGGTEATAMHPNAIKALQTIGLLVNKASETTNPLVEVQFGEQQYISCFSKLYNHPANPSSDFAAIMTCSDAEENCPFIPGVSLRIGTTYNDPKIADGTPAEATLYLERLRQILQETLYAFSLVK